ncbi:MAG: hypothetical protein ACD_76C00082G0001, partial [uncultured bacterium]
MITSTFLGAVRATLLRGPEVDEDLGVGGGTGATTAGTGGIGVGVVVPSGGVTTLNTCPVVRDTMGALSSALAPDTAGCSPVSHGASGVGVAVEEAGVERWPS